MDGEVGTVCIAKKRRGQLIEKTGSNSFPSKSSPLTFLLELPPYISSMKN